MTEAHSQPKASARNPLTTDDGNAYTRLHITPLDAELLPIVIPAASRANARNVSFHTIETFPEKRYGYVELPVMEADKLKQKLNGASLKGSKIRVEKARPEKPMPSAEEDDKTEKKKKKKKRRTEDSTEDLATIKKRKRDPEVVEGVVLTDRKVKRGWTEQLDYKKKKERKSKDSKDSKEFSKDKSKRTKSKFTDGEECLLKTRVPPNAIANLSKDDEPKRKKKKDKGKKREVTVHEFEKATKFPSFLKSSSGDAEGQGSMEYIEGKGWVDAEGNVIESVKETTRPAPKRKAKAPPKVVEEEEEEEDDDSTSSSGTSSSSSGDDSDSEEEEQAQHKGTVGKEQDGNVAEDTSPESKPQATPLSGFAQKTEDSRRMSASSNRSLTIKIPPPATPDAAQVHPLEALYKRAKPTGEATQTPAQQEKSHPFSFFGAGDDDDDDIDVDADAAGADPSQTESQMPMTPYTRQDFESRNIRSAAPTPDTAHPSRMRNFWASQDGDDDEPMGEYDDEEGEEQQQKPTSASSDFQAWFWENRRELNRSWMGRRKTAAKERRHRENKARSSKTV